MHLNLQGVERLPERGQLRHQRPDEMSGKVNGPFPAGFTMPGHCFMVRAGEGHDLKVSFLLTGKVDGNGTVTDVTIEIRQLECGVFDLL